MKPFVVSLRAGLAALSLAAGLVSAAAAGYRTWQTMEGPTRAAIAALEALPDHAPAAAAWMSKQPDWVVEKEAVSPLQDLPGYSLRTLQLKPRQGVSFSELATLIASGEQASPAWRTQQLEARSVAPARVDVSRLVFSRVERSVR